MGKHKLVFEIVGANPQAVKSYLFGLDFILSSAVRVGRDGASGAQAGDKLVASVDSAEASPQPVAADEYPHQGLDAAAAAAAMRVPEGFQVSVCAAEPDVKQPIAMALD